MSFAGLVSIWALIFRQVHAGGSVRYFRKVSTHEGDWSIVSAPPSDALRKQGFHASIHAALLHGPSTRVLK